MCVPAVEDRCRLHLITSITVLAVDLFFAGKNAWIAVLSAAQIDVIFVSRKLGTNFTTIQGYVKNAPEFIPVPRIRV